MTQRGRTEDLSNFLFVRVSCEEWNRFRQLRPDKIGPYMKYMRAGVQENMNENADTFYYFIFVDATFYGKIVRPMIVAGARNSNALPERYKTQNLSDSEKKCLAMICSMLHDKETHSVHDFVSTVRQYREQGDPGEPPATNENQTVN